MNPHFLEMLPALYCLAALPVIVLFFTRPRRWGALPARIYVLSTIQCILFPVAIVWYRPLAVVPLGLVLVLTAQLVLERYSYREPLRK
jgi:hypothetical protein